MLVRGRMRAQELGDFGGELAAVATPLFGGAEVFHARAEFLEMERFEADVAERLELGVERFEKKNFQFAVGFLGEFVER